MWKYFYFFESIRILNPKVLFSRKRQRAFLYKSGVHPLRPGAYTNMSESESELRKSEKFQISCTKVRI